MLLCDVMEEREYQLQLRKRKQDFDKKQEKMWLEQE